MSLDLDALKQEATELGINFPKNIGAETLAAKIEANEKSEEKSAVSGNNSIQSKAKLAEAKARETRIITVIDNDQRVNNQTTVATVSCSNMFFDLGTAHIPLNIPVEVRQGHIDVLKGVEIPQHSKDPASGLSRVVIRPRYTISYEDIKK
jgi:hypothetical protein